jgi:uncharacterized protein (DUF305 family)
MTRLTLLAAAAMLALGGLARADDMSGHMAMGAGSGPADEAYAAAMATMDRDMAVEMTGDPDADFVRMMIPHHQGAIDMARAVLQYGTDPDIRRLAEDVVAAQEKEIAFMRQWLAAHGQ